MQDLNDLLLMGIRATSAWVAAEKKFEEYQYYRKGISTLIGKSQDEWNGFETTQDLNLKMMEAGIRVEQSYLRDIQSLRRKGRRLDKKYARLNNKLQKRSKR